MEEDRSKQNTLEVDLTPATRSIMTTPVPTPALPDLTSLSPNELIARINELESRLKSTTAQLAALSSTTTTKIAVEVPGTPQLASAQAQVQTPKVKKTPRQFDLSRYSTRHIALKFAYLGHRYNGLEHTNGGRPPLNPTIEEALWKALRKARLIPPVVPDGCDGSFEVVWGEATRKKHYWKDGVRLEIDWAGCGYSKCGRTDKGVSAFGQVVGVRVRSNRPKKTEAEEGNTIVKDEEGGEKLGAVDGKDNQEQTNFDDVMDELPYISILNSVLPPDIRILAWCPNPGPSFDARFSCKERRYKYFFTNPAFCPTPGPLGLKHGNGEPTSIREGWLDVLAMRKAAKKLEGLHDFRNLCKIDASKQMSSCERRITFADIEEMPQGMGLSRFVTDKMLKQRGDEAVTTNGTTDTFDVHGPQVYVFSVHGTAFLWHQVRCMVAILFLVGQGLEQPEIVDELLDIMKTPARPHYDMADDAPLVLWDCVFPGDEPREGSGIKWLYAGDEASVSVLVKKGDSQYDGKFGIGGLVSDLWVEWREAKMKETLTAGLLSLALSQGDGTSLERAGFRIGTNTKSRSQRIFDGSDCARNIGNYTPITQRERMDTLEAQNAKYLAGKQARRDLKKAQISNED